MLDPWYPCACKRQGAIARVDRFPIRRAEHHLDQLPTLPALNLGREHGCDEPISPTPPPPPPAVVVVVVVVVMMMAAGQLACRVSLDELTLDCTLPASLIDILLPQEAPYDVLGLHTGRP